MAIQVSAAAALLGASALRRPEPRHAWLAWLDLAELEVGSLVPRALLCARMEAWFRRKGYLRADETLQLREWMRAPSRIVTP